VKLRKAPFFSGKLSFILFWPPSSVSFCLSASTAATYIFTCSYLYNYYSYSPTLCIKCWVSPFHTQEDSIKFPYFADLTQRGDRGWKEAQRQGEDRVTLQKTLLVQDLPELASTSPVPRQFLMLQGQNHIWGLLISFFLRSFTQPLKCCGRLNSYAGLFRKLLLKTSSQKQNRQLHYLI
jgi:hypothetical protein